MCPYDGNDELRSNISSGNGIQDFPLHLAEIRDWFLPSEGG